VRRFNADTPSRLHQTVEFFHGPHHVGDMFDDVDRPQVVERPVGERVREPVEIADYIGGAGGVEIDPDRAGVFADSAADIEDS
jgi:hypothetical protein